MATEFARIKNAVEQEKINKMQSEARLESLASERKRILDEANEITGKNFTSSDELDSYVNDLKSKIEEDVKKMGDILKSEGVSY